MESYLFLFERWRSLLIITIQFCARPCLAYQSVLSHRVQKRLVVLVGERPIRPLRTVWNCTVNVPNLRNLNAKIWHAVALFQSLNFWVLISVAFLFYEFAPQNMSITLTLVDLILSWHVTVMTPKVRGSEWWCKTYQGVAPCGDWMNVDLDLDLDLGYYKRKIAGSIPIMSARSMW